MRGVERTFANMVYTSSSSQGLAVVVFGDSISRALLKKLQKLSEEKTAYIHSDSGARTDGVCANMSGELTLDGAQRDVLLL